MENGDLTPVDLKPLKILLQKLDTFITLRGQHARQILLESAQGCPPHAQIAAI